MAEQHKNPAILTRRSTLGFLTAAAFATASTRPFVLPHLAGVPAEIKAKVAELKNLALDWPSLDKLAQGMVTRKQSPGLALSVMHDGVLLYSKGFGLAHIENSTPATPQTGFRIASITKQFTAAAILLLAEDGKLSVGDPLSRFLPDFPRASEVTLKQLLSHTSGLGDYINGQNMAILTEAQHRDYTSDEVLHYISSKTPLYRARPGAAWLYSNSGFALLGIVVERLSGMSFADFCAERLFKPAGLAMTQIDRTCTVEAACNGYRPDYTAPTKFDVNTPVSPSFIGGAGAIRSTTEDLCRWHCALLNGKVLKKESLAAMLTPVMLNDGAPAYEHKGPEPLEYGFGMGLGAVGDIRYASHGGRVNGFTGHLRSFPAQKLTVAILYNSDGGGTPGFSAVQRALRTEASQLGLQTMGLSYRDAKNGAGDTA